MSSGAADEVKPSWEEMDAMMYKGSARVRLIKRRNVREIPHWAPGVGLDGAAGAAAAKDAELLRNTSKIFQDLQNQVQSWISYKRQRTEDEIRESKRISELYPLVRPKSAGNSDSENSSVDSVPVSAPSSPVTTSCSAEIRSPDDSVQIFGHAARSSGGVWDTTPAFSPMKDGSAEAAVAFSKHLHFNSYSRKSVLDSPPDVTDPDTPATSLMTSRTPGRIDMPTLSI